MGRVCTVYLNKYKNTIDTRLSMCYTVDTKKEREDRTMRVTWAIVKPYINTKGIVDGTALVKWCFNEESARKGAEELNKEYNTTIYTVEEVEMFDTRDSF